jgi:heat shock protein HtpX
MKRIVLFVATNIAVLAVLTVIINLFGLDRMAGTSTYGLLVMAAVIGVGGSFISLLMSKSIAKWSTGMRIIEQPGNDAEAWIVATIQKLAQKAGIGMPEVGIYEGEANAFATGAFRDSALVAVSTGLLQSMNKEEVEAVLGHEMAHVANGDMVTMALIQGVLNTFVIFFARIVASIVSGSSRERGGGGGAYFVVVIVLQVVFGILASIIVNWFSRRREFRADAGSAQFLGSPAPMVNALRRLGGLEPGPLPEALKAFGITDKNAVMALFATHPPIEARIAALQNRR